MKAGRIYRLNTGRLVERMDKNRALIMGIRDAALALIDALEAWLEIERTKHLRRDMKRMRYVLKKNGIDIDRLLSTEQ